MRKNEYDSKAILDHVLFGNAAYSDTVLWKTIFKRQAQQTMAVLHLAACDHTAAISIWN